MTRFSELNAMKQEQRNKKAEQLRLAARIIETGCEWDYAVPDGRISFTPSPHEDDACRLGFCIQHGYEIRIKEPVIPVPEGWRELRDDEKDGRWIIGAKFLDGKGWLQFGASDAGCYAVKEGRIIVPVTKPKKRVPLGPGDVVPGSVVRSCDGSYAVWTAVICVNPDGMAYSNKHGKIVSIGWNQAEEMLEIKRPTDTGWQPCYKEDES